jgi:hypothetical protein
VSGKRLGDSLRLFNRTTAPAAPESGDLWYDSGTAQVLASDGATGAPLRVGPEGNVPIVRSTGWHNLPGFGNAAAANVPDGRLYAVPFWPGRSCTVTGVAANVTLALLGSSLRMGIYESDGVLPTTLLTDFGTVASTLTGLRSITGLSTPVRPVLHFLVIGRQGAGVTLTLSTRSSWDPYVVDTAPTIASNTNAYYTDGVGGALPGTFGVPAGTDQGPCLVVQLT